MRKINNYPNQREFIKVYKSINIYTNNYEPEILGYLDIIKNYISERNKIYIEEFYGDKRISKDKYERKIRRILEIDGIIKRYKRERYLNPYYYRNKDSKWILYNIDIPVGKIVKIKIESDKLCEIFINNDNRHFKL